MTAEQNAQFGSYCGSLAWDQRSISTSLPQGVDPRLPASLPPRTCLCSGRFLGLPIGSAYIKYIHMCVSKMSSLSGDSMSQCVSLVQETGPMKRFTTSYWQCSMTRRYVESIRLGERHRLSNEKATVRPQFGTQPPRICRPKSHDSATAPTVNPLTNNPPRGPDRAAHLSLHNTLLEANICLADRLRDWRVHSSAGTLLHKTGLNTSSESCRSTVQRRPVGTHIRLGLGR